MVSASGLFEAPKVPHLLVIGGGVCGLGAAEEARQLGFNVTIVECDAHCGGLLSTDRRQGFSFDRGGHRFITSIPWILERVRNLLGERLLVRERKSFVFLDGSRLHYPLQLDDLLRQLGPLQNIRAFASYLIGRLRAGKPHAEENLEEWLRRHFGDYLYRRVFEGYSEKLWGVAPSKISAEWAPKRISIPSLGGYLREMLQPSAAPARTYASRYLYPRTGIGEIVEQLERSCRDAGVRILTSTRVAKLARADKGWRAHLQSAPADRSAAGQSTARQSHNADSIEVDAVISTIPLPTLHDVLQVAEKPALDVKLRFRGLRFLNLGFEQPVPLDATWIYNPKRESRFTRIQIPAARSPFMTPNGCGSIQLEEPFDPHSQAEENRGAKEHGMIDRWAEGKELLREVGISMPDPCLEFETFAQHAYPVYGPEMKKQSRALLEWLQSQPALVSVGRQGGFSYVFLDRAWAEGVNAARALAGQDPFEIPTPRGNTPLPIEAASLVENTVAVDLDDPQTPAAEPALQAGKNPSPQRPTQATTMGPRWGHDAARGTADV